MSPVYKEVGRYTILRPLGGGGMAEVYLALDPQSGERIALKVPVVELEAELQGARLQKLLSARSAHVPRVLEIGTDDGVPFIAMEYVEGEDLAERIPKGGLDWRTAVEIALQVCELLTAAHALFSGIGDRDHRILHGDIKPKNIRLAADGAVKVLDFGIARALSHSRKLTHTEYGSLPYMSPERIEDGTFDEGSDLWALGVVLYEMVSGQQPFQAENRAALERRIRSRIPPPAPPLDCPHGLVALLRRALAPRPGDRYASAAEMATDLAALLRGERTLAEALPAPVVDDATRRTRILPADEPAATGDTEGTRRTAPASAEDTEATRRTTADAPEDTEATRRTAGGAPPAADHTPSGLEIARMAPRPKRRWRLRRIVRVGLIVLAVGMAANEAEVFTASRQLRSSLPAMRRGDAEEVWTRYTALADRSPLGIGTLGLSGDVSEWLVAQADRTLGTYRSGVSTVWESDWDAARTLLSRALSIDPGDERVRSRLRTCDGHLERINAQARRRRGTAEGRARANEAIVAFREAAELWPRSTDPWLGMARTYLEALDDLDAGARALRSAEKTGYRLGGREISQLAGAYRRRADSLWRQAQRVRGLPQEKGYLERIRDDSRKALELYERIPTFGDVGDDIRATHARLEQAEIRLLEIEEGESWWR